MCGLAGVFYKNPKKRLSKKVIEDLVYVTQLRGLHSAGLIFSYIQQEKDKEPQQMIGHKKKAGIPWSFVQQDDTVTKQINRQDNKVLAFHCRAATKGKVNDENSHPFRHENIVLMHNGTMRNDYSLSNKYFDVDSEAICYYLSKEKNTPQSFVDAADGAYALVWMDYNGGTLNFLRNDDRPLYFAENDDLIIWASESAFIEFVASRHSIKLNAAVEFPIFTHRVIDVSTNTVTDNQLIHPPKKVATFNYHSFYSGSSLYNDDYYDSVKHPPKKEEQNTNLKEGQLFETSFAGRVSYFHKLINQKDYAYGKVNPHNIVKNPNLPSTDDRANSTWDLTNYDDKLCDELFDPEFKVGSWVTMSILNTRILNVTEYEVEAEVMMPVYFPEIEQEFPTMIIKMSRIPFGIARRNHLLVRGKIDKINRDTGTIIINGGTYISAFDPVVQGQLTIESAAAASIIGVN